MWRCERERLRSGFDCPRRLFCLIKINFVQEKKKKKQIVGCASETNCFFKQVNSDDVSIRVDYLDYHKQSMYVLTHTHTHMHIAIETKTKFRV